MGKKAFWIAIAVVCLLFIMLAVNLEMGDVLGDGGRIAVGILAGVIYLAACIMRLNNAGKSKALIQREPKTAVFSDLTGREYCRFLCFNINKDIAFVVFLRLKSL